MSTPERAGWYDDPEDDTQLRYFDGVVWSNHRVPRQSRATAPSVVDTPVHETSHPPQAGPGRDVFGRPSGAPPQPQHPTGWGTQPPPHQPPAAAGWGQPAVAAPTTADGRPLAGYGARVGAYLIDAVILGLLNLLLTGWAWFRWMADYWNFAYDAAMEGDQAAVNELTPETVIGMLDWRYFFIAAGLSLLLLMIYHVGFLAWRSATPGKMMVGLSVQRVDGPGRIGVGTAFMRILLPLGLGVLSMVPLVSYLAAFVSIADKLWPLKDQRRQALHDKIAGTQVVTGKQPTPGR